MKKTNWIKAVAGLALSLAITTAARAEVSTVRLAQQFGISYLPLTIMKEEKLFEKQAKKEGLDITTQWLRFTAGSGMNDALLSGNLDFAAGGVGPALTIWAKTRRNLKIKGVAALNAMPIDLITINPKVKTLADFTSQDKIALPGVKTSIQAITLQMASEKELGPDKADALDRLTVSMGHPDAQVAMMGGRSEITAHFASSPYQEQELKDPRAKKILDSYEVLGGPHTFNLVWASTKFVEGNPKVTAAFMAALREAQQEIRDNPARAAAIWIKVEGSKMTPEEVEAMIRNPQNEWTTTPKKMITYLNYMNRAKLVSADTDDWRDLFFPTVASESGS